MDHRSGPPNGPLMLTTKWTTKWTTIVDHQSGPSNGPPKTAVEQAVSWYFEPANERLSSIGHLALAWLPQLTADHCGGRSELCFVLLIFCLNVCERFLRLCPLQISKYLDQVEAVAVGVLRRRRLVRFHRFSLLEEIRYHWVFQVEIWSPLYTGSHLCLIKPGSCGLRSSWAGRSPTGPRWCDLSLCCPGTNSTTRLIYSRWNLGYTWESSGNFCGWLKIYANW